MLSSYQSTNAFAYCLPVRILLAASACTVAVEEFYTLVSISLLPFRMLHVWKNTLICNLEVEYLDFLSSHRSKS